jgi:hypothetical protein
MEIRVQGNDDLRMGPNAVRPYSGSRSTSPTQYGGAGLRDRRSQIRDFRRGRDPRRGSIP